MRMVSVEEMQLKVNKVFNAVSTVSIVNEVDTYI